MAENAWTAMQRSTAQGPALGMGIMTRREAMEDRDLNRALLQENAAARTQMGQESLALRQQQAAEHAAQLQASTPKYKQRMDPSLVKQSEAASLTKFGKVGVDAMRSLLDESYELAKVNPNSTFGDVYHGVKNNWEVHRENILDKTASALASGKLSPIEQKQIAALHDLAAYDTTGEAFIDNGVFKTTAASIKMEEKNSKAALLAERIAGQNERSERTDTRIRDLAAENMELKRDRENRLGQPKPEKADKSLKEAVGRIDRTIAEYERKIKNYQIEARNAKSEKDVKWYQDAIDALEEQVSIAKETRGGVQGGTIPVESINWGGQPATKADTTGALKVGEVRKGYKFRGGDPADQNSWEKI